MGAFALFGLTIASPTSCAKEVIWVGGRQPYFKYKGSYLGRWLPGMSKQMSYDKIYCPDVHANLCLP
jgi:hypothetical protein